MPDKETVHTLYKKLINLYPQRFKEQFSESIEQTFNDLYKEQNYKSRIGLFGFIFRAFIETGTGIIREYSLLLIEGNTMKNIFSNPTSAAFISAILSLPLAIIYVSYIYDIEFFTINFNNMLTISGQGGDINMLGRIVIFGGLLLLPVAFVLNLQPMLVKEGPEGRRNLHVINLIVGAIILILITFTWGSLLIEEIYCLQGIRCD